MITLERIEQLLKAQDELNKVYAGEDWATKGYDFLGYVAVETAELLNHHGGMFHYRHQEPDWPQIEMELVDILHFLLSAAIQAEFTADDLLEPIGMKRLVMGEHTVHFRGKRLINEATSMTPSAWVCWVRFILLVEECGYTINHIFNRYILKHTLNRFRIDNGSVTGGYKKVWGDGREDNEHLQELAPKVFDEETNTYDTDALRVLLDSAYRERLDGDLDDPLERLSCYGFFKLPDGNWEKFCATMDERESAVSKVVCTGNATATSTFIGAEKGVTKGWKVTASLKERRKITS